MLSPWFPPRYVWSAVEGVAGLDITTDPPGLEPRMAPSWGWYGMRDVPFRGRKLTWFVVRTPELRVYANVPFARRQVETYAEDVSHMLRLSGGRVMALGLRRPTSFALFIGNPNEHTVAAALAFNDPALSGTFTVRVYNSLRNAWIDAEPVHAERFRTGIPFELEPKGFCVVECTAVASAADSA